MDDILNLGVRETCDVRRGRKHGHIMVGDLGHWTESEGREAKRVFTIGNQRDGVGGKSVVGVEGVPCLATLEVPPGRNCRSVGNLVVNAAMVYQAMMPRIGPDGGG